MGFFPIWYGEFYVGKRGMNHLFIQREEVGGASEVQTTLFQYYVSKGSLNSYI